MRKVDVQTINKTFDEWIAKDPAAKPAKDFFNKFVAAQLGVYWHTKESREKYVEQFLYAFLKDGGARRGRGVQQQPTGQLVGQIEAEAREPGLAAAPQEPDAIVFQTVDSDGKEQRMIFRIGGGQRVGIQVIPGSMAKKEIAAIAAAS